MTLQLQGAPQLSMTLISSDWKEPTNAYILSLLGIGCAENLRTG